MREEDLIKAILERDKTIDRAALEQIVEEKMKTTPFLTRRGALLIILEERRLAQEFIEAKKYNEYIRLDGLTSGLHNVNLAGRILGLKVGEDKTGGAYAVMRLSDGSGAVDVFADRPELFKEFKVGEAVGIKNCSISTSRKRNKFIVRTGSKTTVEKLDNISGLPDFEALFIQPGEAMSKEEEQVDVSAVVVYDTGLRRTGDLHLNTVIITDGEIPYLLHAYREQARRFENSQGKRFYATNLYVRKGELYTSSATCITFGEKEPDKIDKIISKSHRAFDLKIIGKSIDGTPVAFGDGKIFRTPTLTDIPIQTVLTTQNAFIFTRHGIPHLFFEKYQVAEIELKDLEPRIFGGDLGTIDGRLTDFLLQAEVVRKTSRDYVETKFGTRALVRFWMKVDDVVLNGVAWGDAAERVGEIPEKTVLRLAFPIVKRNKFGEIELTMDGLTAFC
ncbi:MAG: hypothetical protein NZ581_07835 [Candidatus Caldarchaeum sp.]|nr:hypothetical protein [Candidatus Caldarchaeum sp.]MDW8436083.1 hypothetical protein [Candidatus Caldarchaeum sp.]